MTARPTFKPGDLVERTGESALGLVKGERYRVKYVVTDESGSRWLMFAEEPGAQFNPRGFRLVEEG